MTHIVKLECGCRIERGRIDTIASFCEPHGAEHAAITERVKADRERMQNPDWYKLTQVAEPQP